MNKSNSRHIKDSATSQPNKEAAANDSNTNVIRVWGGPRSPHTFRCCDQLWKAFVQETKARGDSVCHYMETIIAAILGVMKGNDYKSDTIRIENLSVQRVVKRYRRVSHEILPEDNCYDPLKGWFFVMDDVLNGNGHAIGCKCSVCFPFMGRRSLVRARISQTPSDE